MNNICKKTITFSIILLLIGITVSSAISIDTKSPVVNQQSEEDCNCKEIDSRHLVVLERQLNRLEVYSKLLLVLSNHNPELFKNYEELTDMISTLNTLDLKDLICNILGITGNYFDLIGPYYIEKAIDYFDDFRIILGTIFLNISIMLMVLTQIIAIIYFELGCQ